MIYTQIVHIRNNTSLQERILCGRDVECECQRVDATRKQRALLRADDVMQLSGHRTIVFKHRNDATPRGWSCAYLSVV